jgi:Flp pilus assembly protein TadD
MGLIAQRNGDLAQAISRYSHAMSVQPTSVGYLLLAKALQRSGRAAEAQAAYEQAQRLSSDLSQSEQAVERLLAH